MEGGRGMTEVDRRREAGERRGGGRGNFVARWLRTVSPARNPHFPAVDLHTSVRY
jgi:hypothetical protein